MAPLYKRVQYQLQNGFRVPYYDIIDIGDPEPYPSFTPSQTPTLTPTNTPSATCTNQPASDKECLVVSYVSGSTVSGDIEGTYRFFSFGEYESSPSNLNCGCDYDYATYRKVDDPNYVLYKNDLTTFGYTIIEVLSGYFECDTTFNSGLNYVRNIPTENIGGKLYPLEGNYTWLGGGPEPRPSYTYNFTYVSCPTPTPSTTPSNTPTQTLTPTNTQTPTETSTSTPTPTPTITSTNTPTTTNTQTPTTTSTPTPSPSGRCPSCTTYGITNNDRDLPLSISYTDCDTAATLGISIPADSSTSICSCDTPVRTAGSTDYTIQNVAPC